MKRFIIDDYGDKRLNRRIPVVHHAGNYNPAIHTPVSDPYDFDGYLAIDVIWSDTPDQPAIFTICGW